MNQILQTYIPHQILTFLASPRCCYQVNGALRSPERLTLMEHAKKFGIRLQLKTFNGVITVKMCKRSCMHFLQSPVSLSFSEGVREICDRLSQLEFFGSTADLFMSPYLNNINKPLPKLPQVRFNIGNRTPDNPLLNGNEKTTVLDFPIKRKLNDTISNNNVVIVNTHLHDLSTLIPHMLLSDHKNINTKCRILVVETQPLLAIYNSNRAASLWNENIGHTVGCQYALYSCVNAESLIIYTTAEFVLRTLMGKSQATYFSSITHVIVADVQLEKIATHVLLCELRQALKFQTQLKVIILSSTSNDYLKDYFKQGFVLDLPQPENVQSPQFDNPLYLEEIMLLVTIEKNKKTDNTAIDHLFKPYKTHSELRKSLSADKYLEQYGVTGSKTILMAILLLADLECENINYQHSKSGVCAIILASHHGNAEHVRMLLNHNASPFLKDSKGNCAVSIAFDRANKECIEVFNAYCRENLPKKNYHASFIEFELLADLVESIMVVWTPSTVLTCNIIIFLPTYEDLLKMEFCLLRNQHLGLLPQSLKIHLVHESGSMEQLNELILPATVSRQIVLSTGIGETLYFLLPFSYVIDTARECHSKFNEEHGHRDESYHFTSKQNSERRSSIIDRACCRGKYGNVFRYLPRNLYEKLHVQQIPEIMFMSLEKVCLTVKLLAPHKMIAEYLQETPRVPSFYAVNNSIMFLKKIGILDEMEDVTWLGVRIIDLPVDVQLAKMLIFGIILQCMDPIVTMVTFMATYDPVKLPNYCNVGRIMPDEDLHEMRSEFKKLRIKLSNGIFSDHFMMLNLYQEWQNNMSDKTIRQDKILQGEPKFVLDGLLIHISEVRTNLVAALRAAHLIHASGCFSMANINHKSNCWPLIKAVLVAGLYPHILLVDPLDSHFKSNRSSRILLHPETILRHDASSPAQMQDITTYKSPWVIYSKCFAGPCSNSISNCTVVSGMAIILFSGTEKTYPYHIVHNQDDSGTDTFCHLYLDDWLWFFMKKNEAVSVLKLRKYMFHIVNSFLKDCDDSFKLRDLHTMRCYNIKLFTAIQNILVHEDEMLGFKQPHGVGIRPKAISYTISRLPKQTFEIINCNESLTEKFDGTNLKKIYYLIFLPENLEKDTLLNWIKTNICSFVAPKPNLGENILNYYFLFNKENLVFQNVFMNGFNELKEYELRECFRNDIPLKNLIYVCEKNKIPWTFKTFQDCYIYKLDQIIGEIIIHLYAYYKHF